MIIIFYSFLFTETPLSENANVRCLILSVHDIFFGFFGIEVWLNELFFVYLQAK